MGSFNLNGKVYETHDNGYVDGWDKEAARYFAKEENVDLTEERWRIVDFFREYYLVLTNLPASEEYKIMPMIEILIKAIEKRLGSEKANAKYLNELFPDGLTKQACKIAGIPSPTGGFDLNGKVYKTDDYGYLEDRTEWSMEVADYLAKEEGLNMTDAHWEIINFLREYYEEFKITLEDRLLIKAAIKKLGNEKGNKEHLYELFPRGAAAQAGRIAGVPVSQGCK